MYKHLMTAAALCALSLSPARADADTVTLNVDTKSAAGTVRAAVFAGAAAFEADTTVANIAVPAGATGTRVVFSGLAPGSYGIALFHDVNGNEELDRNLFGAPTEPFGFANNPKIGFSAPAYESFQFDFNGAALTLDIILNGAD